MSRKTVFTTITPIPPTIPQTSIIDFLHSHIDIIDLNPAIKERYIISPPSFAPPEEHHHIWFSVTEQVPLLPGGIRYTCALNDLPNGVRKHVYGVAGLDLRSTLSLEGAGEIGVGGTGLFLREDVILRCNVLTTSHFKKSIKKSHHDLIDRLRRKASRVTIAALPPNFQLQSPLSPDRFSLTTALPPNFQLQSPLSPDRFSLPSSRNSSIVSTGRVASYSITPANIHARKPVPSQQSIFPPSPTQSPDSWKNMSRPPSLPYLRPCSPITSEGVFTVSPEEVVPTGFLNAPSPLPMSPPSPAPSSWSFDRSKRHELERDQPNLSPSKPAATVDGMIAEIEKDQMAWDRRGGGGLRPMVSVVAKYPRAKYQDYSEFAKMNPFDE